MKEYICTHCGWVGTDPKPFPSANLIRQQNAFVCPRCTYLVLEVKEKE